MTPRHAVRLGRRISFVPASDGALTLAGSTPPAPQIEESARMPARRAIRLESVPATLGALGFGASEIVVGS